MRTFTPLALVLSLVFALGRSGGAAPPSEEERQARRAYRQAEQHFRGGLFAEALAQYQAGYDAFPLPGFLINIAQCHRRLGDLRKARATYRKFLMVAPESPHAAQVRGLVTELDRLIAELDEEANDGKPEKDGKPATAESAPAAGTTPAAEPASRPRVPEAPPPSPDPQLAVALAMGPSTSDRADREPSGGKRRWWIWALAGAGVVAAGTAAALVLTAPEATTIDAGTLGTLRR
jgi:tetratricopeptide (TPR) repeat protein